MAFDAFLKLEGIDGESTDSKHAKCVEVLSFSWGLSQPSAGSRSSGGAAGGQRADFHDFSIVKALDKASPKLFLHCANGTHIPTVTLQLCRATGNKDTYMEYKLENVLVSSYRPGGSCQGGEPLPLEEVSFNYGKITQTYNETDHKTGKKGGSVPAHWSTIENKGG